jgi:hypothetical protein
MKIGIITFWWSADNYGQILQCYALQKYLRDAGHDAYLIRYDPRNDYVKTSFWKKVLKAFNPIKLFNYVRYKVRKLVIYVRKFDSFRKQHIRQSEKIYYSYQELMEDPPEADVYIVGSDQVWNPDFIAWENTNEQVKAYFLDFGDAEKKRIAYATSFGKEQVAGDYIREITPLLKKFDYVSVREKSGLDICRQCGVDAEWVPDPTMLLNVDDYRALYTQESVKMINKPYCLLYMLDMHCNFSIELIHTWAKSKKISIIYVTANGRYDKHKKLYATIPEWLYLIDHAEYVITNSFHGSVFSLLFQKRFGILSLTGKHNEMNTRFYALFELLGIKERFINHLAKMDVLDEDIDWEKVADVLRSVILSCKITNRWQKFLGTHI